MLQAAFVFGNLAAAASNVVVYLGQREIAATCDADKAVEYQRTQQMDAMRKRQVVNEATLLMHQEEALKAADRLGKKLREIE